MNPFQQMPPQFQDGIPIEAQVIATQPEAINMLKGVNGFEMLSLFYFQMPFMLKPQYTQQLEKNGKTLIKYAGLSFIAGTVLNIQIKKLHMNFLNWPIYARLPTRFAIMALPFIASGTFIINKIEELEKMIYDLQNKKNRLVENRNLYEYFDVPQPSKNKKK